MSSPPNANASIPFAGRFLYNVHFGYEGSFSKKSYLSMGKDIVYKAILLKDTLRPNLINTYQFRIMIKPYHLSYMGQMGGMEGEI